MDIRLKNILSSIFLVVIGYCFYRHQPYYFNYFDKYYTLDFFSITYVFSNFSVLKILAIAYVLGFTLIYIWEPEPEMSKSVISLKEVSIFLRAPIQSFSRPLPRESKTAILSVLVKFFFVPLMASWLVDHITILFSTISYTFLHYHQFPNLIELFREKLFWIIFQTILFLDVLFFTVGYLIEHKSLGNKILSVEPTLLGWIVTLCCYPPFRDLTALFFPWQSQDFPVFENQFALVFFNIILLILLSIYTAASVALCLKASNLTHRGIVKKGPYRYVRHPAYVCKNLAWWIGAFPAISFAWQEGILNVMWVMLCIAGWSYLYILRALTEEQHLQSVNGDYGLYMKEVPYRFIPNVL